MNTWNDSKRIAHQLNLNPLSVWADLKLNHGNRQATYKALAASQRGKKYEKWWGWLLLPVIFAVVVADWLSKKDHSK